MSIFSKEQSVNCFLERVILLVCLGTRTGRSSWSRMVGLDAGRRPECRISLVFALRRRLGHGQAESSTIFDRGTRPDCPVAYKDKTYTRQDYCLWVPVHHDLCSASLWCDESIRVFFVTRCTVTATGTTDN